MKKILIFVCVFALSMSHAQQIKKTDYIVNSLTGLRMGVTTTKENGSILKRIYFAYVNTSNQFDNGMTLAESSNEDDFLNSYKI
nr:hypothetical protein [uncultured Flavobacterium sp.]